MARTDVSESLANEIEQLALVLSRQRGLGDLDPAALTVRQRVALRLIIQHEPLHLHRLARFMVTTDPTATRTVDALESQELATRTKDPSDGRAVLISSTRKGRGHVEETRRRLVERLRTGLTQMSRTDQERLAALLSDLNTLLERSGPGPDDAAS